MLALKGDGTNTGLALRQRLLLQACLGLSIDAPRREVRFLRPWLPAFLPSLRIDRLRVGGASVDLLLTRYPESVGIHVVSRRGELDVVTVK